MLVEIGGTVGDIESLPFLEAIRQLGNELGRERAMFVHLTLLPWMPTAGELKTKPTQHSVKELLSVGIQPDLLLCRCGDKEIPANERRKIALFCNVSRSAVIQALDVDTIYQVPIAYHDQGFDARGLPLFRPRRRHGARTSTAGAASCARVREPEGEVTHRRGRQVHGAARRLQVAVRGADPWRLRQQREGRPGLDRLRDLRARRRRQPSRARARHPGAGRLRRARHRRQDPGGAVRARAQGAVLRHLLRHADGGDRGGAQPARPGRRVVDRVRPVPSMPWSA